MAAITATQWTQSFDQVNSFIVGKIKENYGTITLASGLGEYAASGIPLATAPSSYGMVRQIDRLQFFGVGANSSASGVVWKFDAALWTLRGFFATGGSLTQLTSTVTVQGQTFHVCAQGW